MNKLELQKLAGYKRPKDHKYGAIRVTCRLGHNHPSKAEAMHCWSLQAQMNSSGSGGPMIKDLEYEKPYDLIVCGKSIGIHKPDFTYKQRVSQHEQTGQQSFVATSNWIICVDEVKGFATADWKFKSKLFTTLYPEIRYRVIK